MATKTIDSDLIIKGAIKNNTVIEGEESGDFLYPLQLKDTWGNEARFATKSSRMENMVGMFSYSNSVYNGGIYFYKSNSKRLILSFDTPDVGDIIVAKSDGYMEVRFLSQGVRNLAEASSPLTRIYSTQFIVPNGTASQFLKADGSLDSDSYALHTDLNSVKNNAWKLDEANAEVSTVVVTLQGNMSVFAAMEKAGINYQTSRNIYVDMSEAEFTITDIFAGYENLPVGIRYHIFFGNTKHDCKINWNESKVESNLVPSLGITPAYPTAKCEFMRVTEEWTYADWEAKIENVSHVIDTGTASESDNSTLMNYMDNNKVSYTKTAKGALVNITALLAALAGNK